MLKQTLSVCLIVKDEEKLLGQCLDSIKDIAEEIVVVDTGSKDSTKEIAKSFGAKVIEYEWKNDFSDARNISLENATKDWILFLDADEEIPENHGKAIKDLINSEQYKLFEGYYLRLVNIVDSKELGDSIVFRLFKNRKEYRFVGKMHEQIINSVQDRKGPEAIGSTQIKILHYGYDSKISDQIEKCRRNISLLLSYDDKDKDGYYYYSLGNEYTRSGDYVNAKECYDKAIIDARKSRENIPIYYAYLISAMLKLFYSLKQYKSMLEYIELFKEDAGDFKEIYFMEALAYIDRSCFTKGKASLEKYLECSKGPTKYTYPSNNFDVYNIPNIMQQLNSAIVQHEKSLLSSVVIYKNNDENIIETVKSLNEISREVIVVYSKNVKSYIEKIEEFGGKIVKSSSSDELDMFLKGVKLCKGKFVLKLYQGEICSAIAQKDIVGVLSSIINDGYRINIVNYSGELIEKDIRIIRNNKRFKNMQQFKNFITRLKIFDSALQIHKINEVKAKKDNEVLNVEEMENKNVLIGGILNSDIGKCKEFLQSIAKIKNDNLRVDYYFFSSLKCEEFKNEISTFEEDSEVVIIKEIKYDEEDSIKYANDILNFALNHQYDYLLLIDSIEKVEEDIIYKLLILKKDIVIKKLGEQESIIMLTRESILQGIDFSPIKVLNHDGVELNLLIKGEVLNLEVCII